ncbi:MAG: sigma-70 family RNA polymerase sigma factor [Chloroflexales bacterium]|nr:sigma-70 family RNA polymerase sigma factor [Chloroflexales bacterium]
MSTTPAAAAVTTDDAALLHLLHHQPEEGAAALYDRFGRVVFSVVLRIVGDRGVAEEVTQDVFVSSWRAAAHYRPERGSVIAWLLGIAHHRAIDELRSRRHQARRREDPWEEVRMPAAQHDPALDLRLLQAEVRAALAGLPVAQREVIELLYFGGLTRQEAANQLRAPLGTVHTRLRLGMAKLRHTLAHLLHDEDSNTAHLAPSHHAEDA